LIFITPDIVTMQCVVPHGRALVATGSPFAGVGGPADARFRRLEVPHLALGEWPPRIDDVNIVARLC